MLFNFCIIYYFIIYVLLFMLKYYDQSGFIEERNVKRKT